MSIIDLKNKLSNYNLIVFDSDCPFCSKQIRFIQKFNKNNKFKFVPRSSQAGQYIRKISQLEQRESLLFLNQKNIFTESDAVIKLLSLLPFPYSLIYFTKFIPRFLRNLIYRFIAKYRQKIPVKHCTFDNQLKKNILEKIS